MTWRVEVDWENNGTYEDIIADIIGEISFISGLRSYEQICDEDTLSFVVDNSDREYSPEYSSGSLYGDLEPGRKIRITHTNETAGVFRQDFTSTAYTLTTNEQVDSTIEYAEADLPAGDVGMRLTGKIVPDYSETYTFYVKLPERSGLKMWVDDVLIIDEAYGSGSAGTNVEESGTAALVVDVPSTFKIEIRAPKYLSNPVVELRWESASQSKELIPAAAFQLPDYTLWSGFIESINPTPLLYGERIAAITAFGHKRYLDYNRGVDLEYEEDADPRDVVARALQAVFGSTVDLSGIGPSYQTIPFFNDNLVQEPGMFPTALDVLREVVVFEDGRLLFGRGRWQFWGRQRLWNLSTTTDVTLDNTMQDMVYTTGIDRIINKATATVYPRQISTSLSTVYTLTTEDERFSIPLGQTKTFKLWLTREESSDLVAVSDHEALSQWTIDTGLGAPYTTGGFATFKNYGRYIQMSVTNSTHPYFYILSGEMNGYIIGQDGITTVEAEDTDSQDDFGVVPFEYDSRLLASIANAESLLSYKVQKFKAPFPHVLSVTLIAENDGTENANMIAFGIGHTVRIIDDQTSHDADYVIVGEEHTLSAEQAQHTVVWHLEAVQFDRGFLILDDADFGKLDTGRLGY